MCDPVTLGTVAVGVGSAYFGNKAQQQQQAPAPLAATAAPLPTTAAVKPPDIKAPAVAAAGASEINVAAGGTGGVNSAPGVSLDDIAVNTTPLGVTTKPKIKKISLGGIA